LFGAPWSESVDPEIWVEAMVVINSSEGLL
jgi:hypothetical protein